MSRTISTRFAIDGEAEYKAKLKSINAELALHKSELEKVQAQYKNSANSLEALSAKQSALRGQLEALTRKHDEQAAALEAARHAQREYAKQAEELRAELDKMKSSSTATAEEQEKLARDLAAAEENMRKAENAALGYQKQINRTERDQYKLGDELKRTDQYLEEARASADGCAHSIDQYGKEVKEAGESSQEFAQGAQQSAAGIEQLSKLLTAAGVAMAVKEIAGALNECVDTFAAFEAQMSTVQAISGASGGQMEQLGEKAREMGATTAFTAAEAGQALEYMAMAGWKTEDMLGGLEGIMNLASASGEDLASTSDIVTDALTAFGLTAQDSARFADVLAAASSNANTNVGLMGETFRYAAPVAGALGYSIEDTALAIGLMANSGIKGSQAGSALRAALTNLAKPSDTVAGYMEQLGVSLTDSSGAVRSLSELMELLRERFAGLTDAQQAEYAAGLAGKEAMSGLLAIVNASETDYQKLAEAINTCSGSAQKMSDIKLDNFAGQMTLLGSAADGLKLAVGQQLTPALTDLAEAGTDVLTWATDFVDGHPEVVAGMSALAAATGVLTVGVGALAAAHVAQAHAAEIAAAKTAILNTVTSANPFILAATAAAALVAALGAYVAVTEGSSDSTKKFTAGLKESKAAYDDLMVSMGEEQADAAALADALDGLLAVEGKSAAQKAAIKGLVDDLNEAVPGLSLVYDEEKDSLEGLTAAELAEALAMAQAQEKYEAQADRLKELYVEQAEIAQRLGEAKDGLAEAETRCAGDVEQAASSYGAMAGQQQSAEAATAGLRGTVDELTAAQADNAAQIAELEAATAAYAETQGAAAQGHGEMAAAVEVLRDQMAALQQSYVEAKEKAVESLERQMGLFNEMDGKAKTSVEELIKTLSDQAQYMDDYAANIQKAMEMGVDEGLVKKLSDGSQESAQILDAIVKGGAEDITALNAEFARVEEGKDQFSSVMAELELDFSSEMGKINKKLDDAVQKMNHYEEAYKAGQNNAQGLIDGMESRMEQLKAKAREMAKSALAAYKLASDQHSPSKKFAQAGRYDIQGIIQGAEQEKQNLAAAYEDAAQTALDAMRRHLPSSLEEPKQGADVERHLSAITAAAVNAIADSAASGSGAPIVINLMMPDGAVVASHYFDPLAKYAAANGTPILNQPR